MKLNYLDNYKEAASLAILEQLGISVTGTCTAAAIEPNAKWASEHSLNGPASYCVKEGSLLIDVRDSADCWIRCTLSPNETLTLPAQTYRRLTTDCDNDKRMGLPSVYRVQTTADASANDCVFRFNAPNDSVGLIQYHKQRELVCELCREFFKFGWVTGTGGSISIRHGNRIYMTPSGVQKERIQPDELFVLDINGLKLCSPERKAGTLRGPVLSDCAALFLHAFKQRNAGAVLHSHAISCNLATYLYEGKSEFRISHQEMIKGIAGHGYFDELVVPIIENTAWEHELSDLLGQTIAKYPKSVAVLVRRHGMYVWGDTWEAAKRHGECLHYLFEVAWNMSSKGCKDLCAPPAPVPGGGNCVTTTGVNVVECQRGGMECAAKPSTDASAADTGLDGITQVVLDIEGTTTPITFVKDVLFPYAAENVEKYLTATWNDAKTVADVAALRKLAAEENRTDVVSAAQTDVAVIVKYVRDLIAADKKVTALKQLQGHMWEVGYSSNELKSVVYDDVPKFFQRVQRQNAANATGNEHPIQINIYSSGSREAQKLLFKHTTHGDLRKHISAYFDTTCGQKRSAASYEEISKSLGVDCASQILFVTDIIEEAEAARAAGCKVILSVRPGNAPLPANNTFRSVMSFSDI